MKLPLLFSTSCGFVLLASCSGPRSATTTTSLPDLVAAYELPAKSFTSVKVSCTITSAGKTETLPSVKLVPGRPAVSTKLTNVMHPAEFDFPEVPKNSTERAFPVTPSTPRSFATEKVGWTFEATASPRKGFVMISGTLTQRSVASMVRSEGVPFRPIVTTAKDAFGRQVPVELTANVAARPAIQTLEVPVSIAALPGESYRIPLHGSDSAYAVFTCDVTR